MNISSICIIHFDLFRKIILAFIIDTDMRYKTYQGSFYSLSMTYLYH